MNEMTHLQREIMKILLEKGSSYASPVSSKEIGRILNVNPSYVREQMRILQNHGWVAARNGPGGGYFLYRAGEEALNG